MYAAMLPRLTLCRLASRSVPHLKSSASAYRFYATTITKKPAAKKTTTTTLKTTKKSVAGKAKAKPNAKEKTTITKPKAKIKSKTKTKTLVKKKKSTTATRPKPKVVKPVDEPKLTNISFPSGPLRAINIFHREWCSTHPVTNVVEAQSAMKEMAVAWCQLDATEKSKYDELARQDKERYTKEFDQLRKSLDPKLISRERKVQQFRRLNGLPISRQSRAITRRQPSTNGSGSGGGGYSQFTKRVWNMNESEASQICGQDWKLATFGDRGKLLGVAWKLMNEDEKAKYAS